MMTMDIEKSYPPKVVVERYGIRGVVAFDPNKPDDLDRAIMEASTLAGWTFDQYRARLFSENLRNDPRWRSVFF